MKKTIIFSIVTFFFASIVLTVSLFSEEGGECTHDPATSKTVTGVCNAVTLDNFKPICVDGSGQACPAGTCNCKEGDAHIYQIPI